MKRKKSFKTLKGKKRFCIHLQVSEPLLLALKEIGCDIGSKQYVKIVSYLVTVYEYQLFLRKNGHFVFDDEEENS